MINLTKDDWVEIYYALESKRAAVEVGQDRKWLANLEEIIQKIGPDGEEAIKHEEARPEFLEALKFLADFPLEPKKRPNYGQTIASMRRMAREAIAKIEGKPDHE